MPKWNRYPAATILALFHRSMPYKDPNSIAARQSLSRRQRKYLSNPEKRELKLQATRDCIRQKNAFKIGIIDWIKASTPCMDCSLTFPACCMEFDHRDPEQKITTISIMANDTRVSYGDMIDETQKCDLVCACCHRIRTFQRWGKPILCLKK